MMDWRLALGGKIRIEIPSALALLALIALMAPPMAAQATGNGFLFHEPIGVFSFRGGYSRANSGSDFLAFQQRQFTIGPRGFDALSLGLDLGFKASRRFDIGVSLDGTTRTHASEYRSWLDNNNQPIRQTTNLSTIGFTGNLTYNLRDRGRPISNLAWIPSHYVPYVGVGAGLIYYDFAQRGDFINFTTKAVNADQLSASNWGAMAQVFSGLSYTISPRYSLLTEARYTLSSAALNNDYTELGRIDLSGLSFNVGTRIRF